MAHKQVRTEMILAKLRFEHTNSDAAVSIGQMPNDKLKSPGPNDARMASAPQKKETMKLRRFGSDWKVLIDEGFIKANH